MRIAAAADLGRRFVKFRTPKLLRSRTASIQIRDARPPKPTFTGGSARFGQGPIAERSTRPYTANRLRLCDGSEPVVDYASLPEIAMREAPAMDAGSSNSTASAFGPTVAAVKKAFTDVGRLSWATPRRHPIRATPARTTCRERHREARRAVRLPDAQPIGTNKRVFGESSGSI